MERKEDKKIDWKHNLSEYWNILKNYKSRFSVLLISAIIIELLQVVPKFLFKEIVDKGTLFVDGSMGTEEFIFVLIVL